MKLSSFSIVQLLFILPLVLAAPSHPPSKHREDANRADRRADTAHRLADAIGRTGSMTGVAAGMYVSGVSGSEFAAGNSEGGTHKAIGAVAAVLGGHGAGMAGRYALYRYAASQHGHANDHRARAQDAEDRELSNLEAGTRHSPH